VEFKAKVRDEAKFTSIEDMVEEIHNDIAMARRYFDN